MAETLGVITSAIQLVDTALKAREYVNDFLHAPQEQQQLFSEMDALRSLLEELQKRVLAQPTRDSLQQMAEPLTRFKTTMEHFTDKLEPAKGRLSKFSKQIAWTLWDKKEAKEYLVEFERVKLLLNTWLVLDIWDVGQTQQKDTNQILKSINDAAQEQHQSHSRIVGLVRDLSQHVFDERDKLIEWLSPLNFFPRQAEIFSNRQPGTGEWLLEDDDFKLWKASLGGTIWCRGIPGAGKTVLASIVVHHLRTQFQTENIGVACIYLNHKETESQSPPNLIASLWRQLVFNKPISSTIPNLYAQHHEQRTRPTLNDIRAEFSSVAAEYMKVYIVVDALDEYPEDLRSILLESLATVRPSINLLLTSRPHINISSPDAQLEIRATEDDIRSYVEKQIRGSIRLSKHVATRPEFKDEIEKNVVCNVDGMFLLAKLHMDSLTTKNTIKALREALNNMPKDLEHTYDEAMERIERQSVDDRRIARLVLVWVSNAKRPLSVTELQEALAVEPGDTAFDSDNILDIEILLSVCAGLVVVDSTTHIARLVHYTTQQYLDHIQTSHFPQAQENITTTCLTCLSFDVFAPLSLFSHDPVKEYPLLRYAAEYCLVHAKGEPELPLKNMILRFLESRLARSHLFRWSQDERWQLGQSAPVLWIAAAFNLCEITRHLLLEDDLVLDGALSIASKFGAIDTARLLVNAGASELSSALLEASAAGYDAIVRLLIDNGADVNLLVRGEYGLKDSALYVACVHGHEAVARALIENGAETNWGDRTNGPLHAASSIGSEAIVRLLIANGAKVNKPGTYGTALYEASWNGHEGVSRLLLESGAGVNCFAVQRAASAGHAGMVKLLMDNGADPNMTLEVMGYGQVTALELAAVNGHWDVVGILLEHGDLDLLGQNGNALHAACRAGEGAVVSLLIKKGADVNRRNTSSAWNARESEATPLQFASQMGHEGLAQLLIDNDANVDAQAQCSALQTASFEGQESIVKLLLRNGADINLYGILYGTALQAAAQGKHEAVARLLLENGANVNLMGGRPPSALGIALAKADVKMARLLVEYGALAQAEDYSKALWVALNPGFEEMACFLIDNGADVNSQGEEFGTVLEAASAKGVKGIVEVLIEKGADVNKQGGYYGTALQAAAMEGHENIVLLLLKNGADIDAGGGPYGNALQAATMEGRENIVRLLENAKNNQGGP
ncbi:ankyrin repeat-containing domain protein [Mycena epipterygia]|nr:ankyrin repeat-containing domain protein [Mycena epipterygia]